MEKGSGGTQRGSFSVEVYLRLACPACGQAFKRRVVDYLSTRSSSCAGCGAKMVHLARGTTTSPDDGGMDLGALQKFMEQLEGEWTSLVNETLTMDSKRFEIEPG